MEKKLNCPTPHIGAKYGEIAETVLMPGDPLRAKFIAETYLKNVVCYSKIRNMYGFTGEYNGRRISVQGSGMGMPSMGIYSYELYNFYDVKTIIRIGTAGAVSDSVHLLDICFAQAACTDSNYAAQYRLPGQYSPIADFELLCRASAVAKSKGITPHIGNVLTTDAFYADSPNLKEWMKMGVLAAEMETAALYCNAARASCRPCNETADSYAMQGQASGNNIKKALAVLTVSDCPLTGEETTADERETAFTDMIELALEIYSCF
ncbi:MAG: purine-nucleoside phosphorylase [Oscillospiraceae bacterium]|nr:purine-nucleoside phosphorylase [Oscillospiraceae bacterium]